MEDRIAQFRPLVEKAAKRHWYRIKGKTWLAYDDLVQAGYIGLLDGLRRYDPSMGTALSTYLWPTIYGTISKEITSNNHALKVGHRFKRYASHIHASDNQDAKAWAKRLGVSVAEVKTMLRYLATSVQSMDYPYDDNGETVTLHEIVGVSDSAYDTTDLREAIEEACISELDRAIVRLREQGFTNTEIVGMVDGIPGMKQWKRSKNMKQISETLRRLRRRMRREGQA